MSKHYDLRHSQDGSSIESMYVQVQSLDDKWLTSSEHSTDRDIYMYIVPLNMNSWKDYKQCRNSPLYVMRETEKFVYVLSWLASDHFVQITMYTKVSQ